MSQPANLGLEVQSGLPSSRELDQIAEEKPIGEQDASDSLEEGQIEPQPRLHLKTFLALFAICLIYFSQTYTLVGAGAQGQMIAGHFNHPGDAIWLTASLTIPSVILGPVVSQAADFFGRRIFLAVSSLFGAVGCIIAARGTTFAMIIAGLVITGIEFGVLPLLHTVPSEILPRRWRAPAQAAVMIANAFGLIFGLVIGGVFDRHGNPDGFRNYYYISTGLFAIATVIVFAVYHPPPTPLQASLNFRQKMAKLDWIGYVLLASSLVLFCMGLAWSQNPYEWSDPHTSAPFAIGVALGIGLVVYETIFKTDGMFHHGLFGGENFNFAISLVAVFCEGLAFFAATVYFPFQIGILYEEDFLLTSVRFSVAFMATIPASVVTGLYCVITKKVRWVTVLSFLIFVAFFACMATADENTDKNTWGYPVLLGSALGMTLITLVTVAQLSTPPELISVASGLIICIRSLGGTVGIAIYNALFTHELRQAGGKIAQAVLNDGLPAESVDQFVDSMLSHNETAIAQVPGVTPEIVQSGLHVLFKSYVAGFQHVWTTAAAFVALSAFALTERGRGRIIEDCDESEEVITTALEALLDPTRPPIFPRQMVESFITTDQSKIPEHTYNGSEDMWSIIKYRAGHGNLDSVSQDRAPDITKMFKHPRAARDDPVVRLRSFIVLLFEKGARPRKSKTFASILQNHFGNVITNRIPHAIEQHPMLIYVYMHACFEDFPAILRCYEILFNFAVSLPVSVPLEEATNARKTALQAHRTWGVSDRSFLLNSGLIQISFSLPDILQHRAVLRRLREYNGFREVSYRRIEQPTSLDDLKFAVEKSLLDIEDSLGDFQQQVDMFLERFKATLELEFNISNEKMSWVMMWFTFVAIIFTPMAFVSSIFGITTLEADPIWFRVSVAPVLLISLAICYYIFSKSQRIDEGLRPKKLQDLLQMMPYSQLTTLKQKHRKVGSNERETRHSRRPSNVIYPMPRTEVHTVPIQPEDPERSDGSDNSDNSDNSDSSDNSEPARPPAPPNGSPPPPPPPGTKTYVSPPPHSTEGKLHLQAEGLQKLSSVPASDPTGRPHKSYTNPLRPMTEPIYEETLPFAPDLSSRPATRPPPPATEPVNRPTISFAPGLAPEPPTRRAPHMPPQNARRENSHVGYSSSHRPEAGRRTTQSEANFGINRNAPELSTTYDNVRLPDFRRRSTRIAHSRDDRDEDTSPGPSE
ncbi:hypothetical protein G7046_g2767 [Stylonectria norvegica]|nr:hypothetical protein G7046_g2767 [Stylonectria norvegica]